ncbi:MAG: hypothetical protein F6K22_26375 [Okeania sp. SIO2F4]|uniref:hypothetical protein n=1 Tax=Okeania sp. SIO2F4 TaxID=2607790 RepID=UPI00142A138B|nr:hypothetical protein [Okeania sp. SIO2F4]NES06017.1 hypothetical protein [Okeania sp. SIO2F4]
MVDPAELVTLLAPSLPYLIKGSEKISEGLLREVGKDTWERAKAIWQKLWPKIESKEAAKEAVEDLAKELNDEDAKAALRQQLKKILETDETLAQEVKQLMKEKNPTSTGINIEQTGNFHQTAGDNAKQIGQIGSAGNISM